MTLNHIVAENCKLLETLCLLLNEQELQLGAAECLLIAVSRKVSEHLVSVDKMVCFGLWFTRMRVHHGAGVVTGPGS